MKRLGKWKEWSRALKRESMALYFAYRDPKTPWYAKVWAMIVVAYAFSPIDLIPDFIPIIGLLDDLVLIPLGIALAVKLIPQDVMTESRTKAQESVNDSRPTSRVAAGVIIAIWITVFGTIAYGAVRAVLR